VQGREVGDRGPTGHGGIYGTCCLLISARKEENQIRGEGGGALRTAPTKERKSPSK
jgi:hypothetical protein